MWSEDLHRVPVMTKAVLASSGQRVAGVLPRLGAGFAACPIYCRADWWHSLDPEKVLTLSPPVCKGDSGDRGSGL